MTDDELIELALLYARGEAGRQLAWYEEHIAPRQGDEIRHILQSRLEETRKAASIWQERMKVKG